MDCAAEAGSFTKYPKMAEDSGLVGAAATSRVTNQYVVTEKVHGANFCLIAAFLPHETVGAASAADAAVDVAFAKRTAVIGRAEDAEDFYSCRSMGLLRTLAPRAEEVLRRVAGAGGAAGASVGGGRGPPARRRAADAVHIYGELFGGRYPHPAVALVPGLEPVQVGVWYAPGLHFMAFDVAVEARDERMFLDFFDARAACEACGLPFAEPLREGALTECLDFEIEFETTLPARLGLPPLPPVAASAGEAGGRRNLAEGVVIRPQCEPRREPASSAGAAARTSTRGLFKRKIEAFSEKRYQNDDWRKGKAGGAGCCPQVGGEELTRMEIAALVTEQRLANVLSKTGRVVHRGKVSCRQLLEDLKEDVQEALADDDGLVLRASHVLQRELDQSCRDLITRELRAGWGRGCQS